MPIDNIRRISAITGNTLAAWSCGVEVDLVVDQYSGNVVVFESNNKGNKFKLTEFSEDGQLLKLYVINEYLRPDCIFWRHGPDDNPCCTFLSVKSALCLGMACWMPNATNASITKVDHCLVIAYTYISYLCSRYFHVKIKNSQSSVFQLFHFFYFFKFSKKNVAIDNL